jgi:hypothetical protein
MYNTILFEELIYGDRKTSGQASKKLTEIGEGVIIKALDQLASTFLLAVENEEVDKDETRERLGNLLGGLGETIDQKISIVSTELSSPERIAVIYLYGYLKKYQKLDELTICLGDKENEVRWWTLWALGEIGNIDGSEVIKNYLDNNSVTISERTVAFSSLQKILEIKRFASIISESDVSTREKIIESLGVFGGKDALPILYWVTETDPNADVKSLAFYGIEKIKKTLFK